MTQPINWQDWHTQIVNRMSKILNAWGKADTLEYEWLRKAEIAAIKELRKERKEVVH
jgi:hypothetical protein